MFKQDQLNQLKSRLKDVNSFLILLPPEPSIDMLAGALSLHLSLKNVGKASAIGCSTPIKVSSSHLFGVDQIKANIGNRNLVISFDYREDSAENVSYDIDETTGKFNLRIKPKSGVAPLDTTSITYSYTGAEADLVITFGINSLEELGRLYSEEKDFLDQAFLLSLNLSPSSRAFAGINLSSDKFVCFSELIAVLLKNIGVSPTADAATNLCHQLFLATDNFQSSRITPDSFEVAAFLLRSGAQRPNVQDSPSASPNLPTFPTPSSTFPLEATFPPPPSTSGVPADWTGPKIFRGSNLK